jgi:hypothetical protein
MNGRTKQLAEALRGKYAEIEALLGDRRGTLAPGTLRRLQNMQVAQAPSDRTVAGDGGRESTARYGRCTLPRTRKGGDERYRD